MERYTRELTIQIKRVEMGYRYTQMETFMWGSTSRIRNMAEALSLGLVSAIIHRLRMPIRQLNSIREIGGEDYQTDRGNTKSLMVIQYLFR